MYCCLKEDTYLTAVHACLNPKPTSPLRFSSCLLSVSLTSAPVPGLVCEEHTSIFCFSFVTVVLRSSAASPAPATAAAAGADAAAAPGMNADPDSAAAASACASACMYQPDGVNFAPLYAVATTADCATSAQTVHVDANLAAARHSCRQEWGHTHAGRPTCSFSASRCSNPGSDSASTAAGAAQLPGAAPPSAAQVPSTESVVADAATPLSPCDCSAAAVSPAEAGLLLLEPLLPPAAAAAAGACRDSSASSPSTCGPQNTIQEQALPAHDHVDR